MSIRLKYKYNYIQLIINTVTKRLQKSIIIYPLPTDKQYFIQ